MTGRKIDYKREFMLGFGDYYIEAYNLKVKANSMRQRSEPCIALYPSANISGSWVLWNLNTGECYVRRTHWKKLPMPDMIVSKMNELAGIRKIEKGAADPIVQSISKDDFVEPREPMMVPNQNPTIKTMTVEEAEIQHHEEVLPLVDHSGYRGGEDIKEEKKEEFDDDVKPEAQELQLLEP